MSVYQKNLHDECAMTHKPKNGSDEPETPYPVHRQSISFPEKAQRRHDEALMEQVFSDFKLLDDLFEWFQPEKLGKWRSIMPTIKNLTSGMVRKGNTAWSTWKANPSLPPHYQFSAMYQKRDQILNAMLYDDPWFAIGYTREEMTQSRTFMYEVDYPEGTLVDDAFIDSHVHWPQVTHLNQKGIHPHFLTSGNKSIYVAFFNEKPILHTEWNEFLNAIHRYLVLDGFVDASSISSSGIRLPLSLHQETGNLCRFYGTNGRQEVLNYLRSIEKDCIVGGGWMGDCGVKKGAISKLYLTSRDTSTDAELHISIDLHEKEFLFSKLMEFPKWVYDFHNVNLRHLHHIIEYLQDYDEQNFSKTATAIDPQFTPDTQDMLDTIPSTYLCISNIDDFSEEDRMRYESYLREGIPGDSYGVFGKENFFWYCCCKFNSQSVAVAAIEQIIGIGVRHDQYVNRLAKLRWKNRHTQYIPREQLNFIPFTEVQLDSYEKQWLEWFSSWCDAVQDSRFQKDLYIRTAEYILQKCRQFPQMAHIGVDDLCKDAQCPNRMMASRLLRFFQLNCPIIEVASAPFKDFSSQKAAGRKSGYRRLPTLSSAVDRTAKIQPKFSHEKTWRQKLNAMNQSWAAGMEDS